MSRRLHLRNTLLALVAVSATAILPGAATADDESAVAGDVQVEAVAATAAGVGQTTRITFSIENQGSDPVRVTGLRLRPGEPSRVVGFLGTSHSTTLSDVPVAPGEAVQLGPKTFWIEVGPLKSDLPAGTVLPATLLLGRFEAPISVHAVPRAEREVPSTGSLGRAPRQ